MFTFIKLYSSSSNLQYLLLLDIFVFILLMFTLRLSEEPFASRQVNCQILQ